MAMKLPTAELWGISCFLVCCCSSSRLFPTAAELRGYSDKIKAAQKWLQGIHSSRCILPTSHRLTARPSTRKMRKGSVSTMGSRQGCSGSCVEKMGPLRFERKTSRLSAERSTCLSYGPETSAHITPFDLNLVFEK
jgi:hypothetical protein